MIELHQRTFTRPDGQLRYCLVGPRLTLDFHVDLPTLAGLEMHCDEQPSYLRDEEPRIGCWLTGGPCWGEGSSLYATRTLLPLFETDRTAFWQAMEQEWRDYYAIAFGPLAEEVERV